MHLPLCSALQDAFKGKALSPLFSLTSGGSSAIVGDGIFIGRLFFKTPRNFFYFRQGRDSRNGGGEKPRPNTLVPPSSPNLFRFVQIANKLRITGKLSAFRLWKYVAMQLIHASESPDAPDPLVVTGNVLYQIYLG